MSLFNSRTIILGTALSVLVACQSTSTKVTSNSNNQNINQVQQQDANSPKARIAVAQFSDKSNNSHWWNKEIGNGMSDQLTTALVNTNKFIVLERQALDIVLSEQDLASSGRVSNHTGAAFGQIEGAEIAVVASVTEFSDDNSGGSVGSSGFLGNVVSSVTAGFSGSHMAIDLRLIDTRTSRVLAATSVEGGSTDFDFTSAATNFGGAIVGGNLSAWSNTPKEKALREVINKSVEFLLTKIPDEYYRYNQNNVLLAGAKPPKPIKKAQNTQPKSNTKPIKSDRPMTQYERTELASAQAQLYCLGYLDEEEDSGQYTSNTVAALKRYQVNTDLPATGSLDGKTYQSLNETGCMAKSIASGFQAIANAFGGGARSNHEANKRALEKQEAEKQNNQQ